MLNDDAPRVASGIFVDSPTAAATAPPASRRKLNAEDQTRITEALPMVALQARKLAHRWPRAPRDEFESAGNLALVEAALSFDPSFGHPFEAFAFKRVRGSMIRAAKEASYHLDTQLPKIGDVTAPGEAMRTTDKLEAASKGDELRSRKEDLAKAAHILLSADASHGGEDEMLDSIATKTHLAGLAAHLAVLSPRSRALVHELYVVGSTAEIAADRLGISRATLHRHHAEVRAELARLLDPNKAPSATSRAPFDAK